MEDIELDLKTASKLKQQVESRLADKKFSLASTSKSGQKFKPKSTIDLGSRKRVRDEQISNKSSVRETVALDRQQQRSKPNGTSSKDKKTSGLSKGRPQTAESRNSGIGKRASLRDEVLALGGDEGDLKLIEDLDSDSELEGLIADGPDKALKDELSKFMRTMPFKETQKDVHDDTTEEEDAFSAGEDDSDAAIQPQNNALQEKLIVAPQSEWFNVKLASIPTSEGKQLPEKTIQELLEHGRALLRQENQTYNNMNKTNSSFKFYKEMMVSGTLTDKISALTLSAQESPIHNQHPLETLVALSKKRSRSQAVQVLGALKDLFGVGSLLPSDRRLVHFAAQPALTNLPYQVFKDWTRDQALPRPLLREHLILWAYEDWLKSLYFDIIKVLETWSNDEITYSRLRSVDYISDLLKEKPEQEANLLSLLVNKLGDPEKQVASRVSSHLVQLQIPHPFMKSVIIRSIEANILFKRGETWHAKYYAIITLNQTVLNSGQQEVIKRLLDIYFSMFLSLLKEKGSSRKDSDQSIARTQGKTAKTKGKAKDSSTKPHKQTTGDADIQEKIISGILSGINRAYPYAASSDDFFETRLDTLFKITHSSNFSTSIQALMLLQQLCSTHPAASDRFYRTLYESLLDPRLLTTSKHALYINLIYRSLKADNNVKRVQAFVKRLGQIIAMHQPPFVCAIIYLIKDLEDTFPALHSLVDQPENYDSEDGEESKASADLAYDGKKRDPQFSNADRCCIWEIHPLTTHFHPSVSLSVKKLVANERIESKPDLSLHSLISFSDRFVYRSPKKITDALKGVSLMQPMAIANASDMLISGRASGKRKGPALNTVDFARMKDDKVQPDEIFFHKYFSVKDQGKTAAQKKKDKKRKSEPAEDEEDNNDEEEIWKALVDSRPELADDDEEVFDDEDGFMDMASDDDEEIGDDKPDEKRYSDEEDIDLEDDADDALFASDEELDLPDSEEEDASAPALQSDAITDSRGRKKRKMLKDLPTFASAEDYASMMQNED